jgi:hypothetical protein
MRFAQRGLFERGLTERVPQQAKAYIGDFYITCGSGATVGFFQNRPMNVCQTSPSS